MQKGTTSKGMEANKNFGKWLSCGIQISGTFGLHHVLAVSWPVVFTYVTCFTVEELDILREIIISLSRIKINFLGVHKPNTLHN
jgi:hypothetical protein